MRIFSSTVLLVLLCVHVSGSHGQGREHVDVQYDAGWNLLSLPVSPARNLGVEEAFPGAEIVYTFEGGAYGTPDSIRFGQGYWVLFLAPGSLLFDGTAVEDTSLVPEPGWNLLGGITSEAFIYQPPDPEAGITAYEYLDGAYLPATVIEPGRGYWLYGAPGTPVTISSQVHPQLSQQLVVVDSSSTTLLSDSLDVARGFFEFEFDDTIPDWHSGNLIVGGGHGGYLRRITGVENTAVGLSLTTDQASLADAVRQGTIEFTLTDPLTNGIEASLPLQKGTRKDGIFNGPLHVPDDIVLQEGRLILDGMVLFEQGPLKLAVSKGFLEYNHDVDVSMLLTLNGLESFRAVVRGALNAEVDLTLTAVAEFKLEPDPVRLFDPIYRDFKYVVVAFGGVPFPIYGRIQLEFYAGLSFQLNSLLQADYGFTSTNNVNFGADFRHGQWHTFSENDFDFSDRPVRLGSTVSAGVRVDLKPIVTVYLYNVAGPAIALDPYLTLAGAISGAGDWKATAEAGIDAQLLFRVKILDEEIEDFEWVNGNLFKVPIWEYPKFMIIKSGNLQETEPGLTLDEPVQIRVFDTYNNSFALVPVHFEVVQGGGMVEEEKVLTDSIGVASVRWTLGEGDGIQILQASVRDDQGSPIEGAPVNIFANVPDAPVITEVIPTEVLLGELTRIVLKGRNLEETENVTIDRLHSREDISVNPDGSQVSFNLLVAGDQQSGEATLTLLTPKGNPTKTIQLREPEPLAISNTSGALLEANSPACTYPDGSVGNLHSISFDYADPEGKVDGSLIIHDIYSFQPSGTIGSEDITEFARDGDGFSGTITFYICPRFGTDEIVSNTWYLIDESGRRSNALSISFLKPDGGNSPPQSGPGSVAGSPGLQIFR